MAAKRSTPLDDPPSASSDDEETEDEHEIFTHKANEESSSSSSSEEEDEDEEESEEETIEPVNISLEKPKIQNPNSKTAESSTEEESESESEEKTATPVKTSVENPKTITPNSSSIFDFDTDVKSPSASAFTIKPSKKLNFVDSPEKAPSSKRPFSESDIKGKKKIKVSNGDVEDEKKSVIKRVWSDDDELLLLQGFIDYQSKKGCSPLSDMDGFYQFTMDSLPGNASKSQLYEKIRRLKKKFKVNLEKGSDNGEDPVFSKPHERRLFDLSKKIWGIGGCESGGGSTAKSKPKSKPKIEAKEEEEEDDEPIAKVLDFETLYPYWSAGLKSVASPSLKFPEGVEALIKDNWSLIGEVKAKEMDEKWEALFDNEAMLRRRRIALLNTIVNVETTSLGK